MSVSSNLITSYNSIDNISKIIYDEFSKDIFENIFFINLSYLQNNSINISFNKAIWNLRPEIFCNDKK